MLFGAPDGYKVLNDFILVKIDDVDLETKINIRFYTERYEYSILAIYSHGIPNHYLGCIVKCRSTRAGESWNRMKDLYDGDFCNEIWNKIKNDIISNEMNGLSKYIAHGRYI